MLTHERACHCIICQMYADEGFMEPRYTHWIEDIRRTGVSGQTVIGEGIPNWLHSIGLWHSLREPELALFGFDEELRTPVLEFLVNNILEGAHYPAGTTISGVAPMTIKPVRPEWHFTFFGAATAFYRHTPALQMLQVSHGGDEPQLWLRPDEHPDDHWKAQLVPE